MKKLRALVLCLNLAGTAALPAWAESTADTAKTTDVVLIGGGVMNATLGTYLQELQPDWSITMVERLDKVAEESSNGWNNAGTGHSAFMELNYTPGKSRRRYRYQ